MTLELLHKYDSVDVHVHSPPAPESGPDTPTAASFPLALLPSPTAVVLFLDFEAVTICTEPRTM